VDDGVWVVTPDQTVRVLADTSVPVFLYFDRHSYDQAMANLSAPKVEEVIRKRRDHFAPDAKAYVMSWLFDREKVSLEVALQVWGAGSAQTEKSLALLQNLAGLQRYRMVPTPGMSVTVLEAESYLLAALRSAAEHPAMDGSTAKSDLVEHYERRLSWSAVLQHLVGALGLPQFVNAMPFADPARGTFVRPADEKFEQYLAKSGEPFVRCRDGLVVVLPERRIRSLRNQDYTGDVLYANAGDYYDSVDWLTQSQLYRDFEARLKWSPAEVCCDYLAQIDHLHLHQILMKRELCARPDAKQACTSFGIDTLLHEETDVLRRALKRNRTFSRSRGLDEVDPPGLFRASEELVTADIDLFGKIAFRYWTSIAPNLSEIDKLKKAD
jgi:hypothetical protein